tara:strand:- start:345 stop:1280 length:936 start_codon:yes stop_codon:yes gene_type:complete
MEKSARFGYTAAKRGSVLREDRCVEETCDGPQDHRDQGRRGGPEGRRRSIEPARREAGTAARDRDTARRAGKRYGACAAHAAAFAEALVDESLAAHFPLAARAEANSVSPDRMEGGMKRICVSVAGLVLAGMAAAETCSVDQRIELAKAGYDKAEVDALCEQGAGAPTAPVAAAPKTPDEVLAAATYDADDTGPFKRIFSTREKCEFLGDSVKVNNNKKTFGGYYSKVIPYRAFSTYKTGRQFNAVREKNSLSASLAITAFGFGNANETCYAVLVRRDGIAPEDFDSVAAAAEAELDAVTQALNAKGAQID